MPGAQWGSRGFYEEEISKISLESADLYQWSQDQERPLLCSVPFQQTRQHPENNCDKHENNCDNETLRLFVVSLSLSLPPVLNSDLLRPDLHIVKFTLSCIQFYEL